MKDYDPAKELANFVSRARAFRVKNRVRADGDNVARLCELLDQHGIEYEIIQPAQLSPEALAEIEDLLLDTWADEATKRAEAFVADGADDDEWEADEFADAAVSVWHIGIHNGEVGKIWGGDAASELGEIKQVSPEYQIVTVPAIRGESGRKILEYADRLVSAQASGSVYHHGATILAVLGDPNREAVK